MLISCSYRNIKGPLNRTQFVPTCPSNYSVNAYSTTYKNKEAAATQGGSETLLYINVSGAILPLVLAKMQFHLNIVQVDCYTALHS